MIFLVENPRAREVPSTALLEIQVFIQNNEMKENKFIGNPFCASSFLGLGYYSCEVPNFPEICSGGGGSTTNML